LPRICRCSELKKEMNTSVSDLPHDDTNRPEVTVSADTGGREGLESHQGDAGGGDGEEEDDDGDDVHDILLLSISSKGHC
jgi:hypothetical protein